MIKVVFEGPDGEVFEVQAEAGATVMQAATGAMVPGILADCGGAGICATCHAYVHPDWVGRITPPTVEEIEMIDAACLGATAESRLSCQIILAEDMDGLIVRIAGDQ